MTTQPPESPFTRSAGTIIDDTGAASYPGNVVIEGDRLLHGAMLHGVDRTMREG